MLKKGSRRIVLQFVFTCTKTTEGLKKPQWIFFNTVFSNAYLKPSELQHFNNRNDGANFSGHDVGSS